VHLAYLDDSDTKAKELKWQVMSGVIIEAKQFKLAEIAVSTIPELLMPAEKLSQFEEFHACELYGGYGVFAGIDQERRFDAISRLLWLIEMAGLHVVYGAVDLDKLRNEIYASADALDIAFRICVRGIDGWATQHVESQVTDKLGDNAENYTIERMIPHIFEGVMDELVILIVDECDTKIKSTLQKSFRSLRPQRKPPHTTAPFNNFHDDMYFGDSRYSIGIQLADLCSYFIARHLSGDGEIDNFYEMIEPHIVYSQIHPPLKQGNLAKEIIAPKEATNDK